MYSNGSQRTISAKMPVTRTHYSREHKRKHRRDTNVVISVADPDTVKLNPNQSGSWSMITGLNEVFITKHWKKLELLREKYNIFLLKPH
jgi:hypothetical protein